MLYGTGVRKSEAIVNGATKTAKIIIISKNDKHSFDIHISINKNDINLTDFKDIYNSYIAFS